MNSDAYWSVVQAKAKLSEVIRRSKTSPQIIESDGKPVAVVLPFAEFESLEEIRKEMIKKERRDRRQAWLSELEGGSQDRETLELPSRMDRPLPPFGDKE